MHRMYGGAAQRAVKIVVFVRPADHIRAFFVRDARPSASVVADDHRHAAGGRRRSAASFPPAFSPPPRSLPSRCHPRPTRKRRRLLKAVSFAWQKGDASAGNFWLTWRFESCIFVFVGCLRFGEEYVEKVKMMNGYLYRALNDHRTKILEICIKK